MSASAPKTLGKYQIIREIARSNDIVYEAYDPVMNRRVAIKELNIPGGSNDTQRQERIRRFKREVKAAGSLAHPGIVTIYEVEEDQGRHFMAMEYLDGKTLRNELDTTGLLPTDRALEIVIAVLDALAFAHQSGVIHRDIKPENIQLLSSGRVKLTDFGIARLTFEPNITIDGQVFGTPSYMSPEQVVGKEIDARSDLFSVGSVLFEMLTGQKAFPGDSVVSISYAIMNTEPAMPPSAPYSVQELVRNLLAKTVTLRTPSAVAALSSAQQALAESKSGIANPAPPPVVTQQAPYPPPQQAHQPYSYGYQPPQGPPLNVPPGHIFMPPVRRPPLFKPETKLAIWRFMGIVVSLGLILAVIVVGVQSMLGAADRAARGQVRAAGSAAPQAERSDAVRWSQVADQQARQGDYLRAIQSAGYAVQIDPYQPGYFVQLGEYYGALADRAAGMDEAAALWIRSADSTRQAINLLADDPDRGARLRSNEAAARLNAAICLDRVGRRSEAREQLVEARLLVDPESELGRRAQELLDSLS
ncbi:MAG: protein kinase [Chthonomonas sp.]|nr:protein kinase [Chthonomonas sp.]